MHKMVCEVFQDYKKLLWFQHANEITNNRVKVKNDYNSFKKGLWQKVLS